MGGNVGSYASNVRDKHRAGKVDKERRGRRRRER